MKYLVLFIFVLTTFLSALSQEPLKHEKRVYRSPEGRLYIYRSLPIYIRMANSPDEGATSYLLHSENTTKYSNPMYLDSEGYNTIRSPWCVDKNTLKPIYPQQDIIFEIYGDETPPVTKIDYGSAIYKQEDIIYVGSGSAIALTAKDAISGVENIYYSIDGAPFKPYTEKIILQEEKEYVLKYYAVDNVGSVEKLHTIKLAIDKTNPSSDLIIEGDKYEDNISGRTQLVLKAEDKSIGVSKIRFKLDEGSFKTYVRPIHAAYLSEGEHTIAYYSEDKVKNTETEKSYTFYVDKTPPTIVEELIGKSFFAAGKEYSSGRTRLKLTTFDNKAGVKEVFYSVNGSEYEKYEKPFFLTQSSGNLVISAYAVDNVNNKTVSEEKNSKASIPYIDLSGPNLSYSFNGPVFAFLDSIYITSETKITLKARDGESGINKIEYSIDNNEATVFKNPFVIETEGAHQINYMGYDNVENTSTAVLRLIVDNTGPAIHSRFSIPPLKTMPKDSLGYDIYPSHTIIFLSATDEVVGVDKLSYSLDGGTEKSSIGMVSGLTQLGNRNLKVKASDKLGNTNENSINFRITK